MPAASYSITPPQIPFRPDLCPGCRRYEDQKCSAYVKKVRLPIGTSTMTLTPVFQGDSKEPCPKFSPMMGGGGDPGAPSGAPGLHLADPAHPLRQRMDEAARLVDGCVQIELAGERTMTRTSAPAGELGQAIAILDEGIAQYPDDPDLLVAKAGILHASAQFKSAEEVLDAVLARTPGHFEARAWKDHWSSWMDAFRFPRWDAGAVSPHPVMVAHLKHDHRVQIVREGLQKSLAIVTGVQGPPFDSGTQVKIEWVLSKTPYGPLVAYYVQIVEPVGEPSTMEAFLPIFQPTLFSPLEGYYLVQQLAFNPSCFVVLVSGETALLNRKIVFGPKTVQKIGEIATQLATGQSFLPQPQVKSAMQWHMDNFDMAQVAFE